MLLPSVAVMKSDAALCTSEMISYLLKFSLQNMLPYTHWVFPFDKVYGEGWIRFSL